MVLVLNKYLSILLFVFLCFNSMYGQALKINTNYYDSLHQTLLLSNLTHYRIYFEDSLIYQWQDPDCNNDTINTASLMKSITGIAIGELLANGFIQSLDDQVCQYIPEWEDGCEQKVTIRHLLSMTSGVLKKSARERMQFFTTNDWNSFVFQLTLDTLPDTKWSYSNEAGQLLEPIIARASNMDVQEFYDRYVFELLEMKHTRLLQDSVGNYSTIGGASTQMDDLSNMGLAMLNKGRFKDIQVIDPEYFNEMTTPISLNPYYGYLWWLNAENKTYTAMGDGGVMIIVYPEKNLLFVRSHNCKEGRYFMNWMGPEYVKAIGKIVE